MTPLRLDTSIGLLQLVQEDLKQLAGNVISVVPDTEYSVEDRTAMNLTHNVLGASASYINNALRTLIDLRDKEAMAAVVEASV